MVENQKTTILIVDDEPEIVNLLEVYLTAHGYKVITALDGQAGLDIARHQLPDLMILDVMLPKLDGFKIARMLRFDDKYQKIKILMLTAKAQEVDRETGMESGADDFITKPFDNAKILVKIKELLKA